MISLFQSGITYLLTFYKMKTLTNENAKINSKIISKNTDCYFFIKIIGEGEIEVSNSRGRKMIFEYDYKFFNIVG